MLHKHLQADIVGEDSLAVAGASRLAVHARRHVRRRRVQLREEEPGLTSALVADNVPRNGESVDEEFLQSMHKKRVWILVSICTSIFRAFGLFT